MANWKGKGIATQAEEGSSPSSAGLGQGLTFSELFFFFFTVKRQEQKPSPISKNRCADHPTQAECLGPGRCSPEALPRPHLQ